MTTMSPVPGHNDDPKKENSDDNSLGPVDTPQFISMGSSSEDEEDDEPGNIIAVIYSIFTLYLLYLLKHTFKSIFKNSPKYNAENIV